MLTACGDSANSTPTGVVGDLNLTLSTVPDPPASRIDVILRITVTDKAGTPVEGARVELSADMTTMSHPGVGGVLADKGGGIYEGTGNFVMGGPWRVEVVATKDGGQRTTGTFDIEVKDADILK
jgi:hypothetical protein